MLSGLLAVFVRASSGVVMVSSSVLLWLIAVCCQANNVVLSLLLAVCCQGFVQRVVMASSSMLSELIAMCCQSFVSPSRRISKVYLGFQVDKV